MTRQRIERKPIAHHCAEAIDRPAQIGRARREVDADGVREGQHAERRAVTAARTSSGDAPARTWSCSPRPNTISITGVSGSAATCTGTNVVPGVCPGSLTGAADSLRHQYQNVQAGICWRRAKLARDSPLLRHRATRRAIRAGVWVFGIATPPALRIGEPQTPVKTGFVERLRPPTATARRRSSVPIGRARVA